MFRHRAAIFAGIALALIGLLGAEEPGARAASGASASAPSQLVERVGVDGYSQQGSDNSYCPSLSSDGRYVAFVKGAASAA